MKKVGNSSQSTGTKDNIYEVALELFKEYGFQNVTINQICESCGITKRAFYYHWESKEAVLGNLVDSIGIKSEQLVQEMLSNKSTPEILWIIFLGFLEKDIELGPNIIKQVFITQMNNNSSAHYPYTAHLYNIVLQLITNAVEKGEIACRTNPEDICFLLFHLLRSTSYSWAAQDGNTDLIAESRRGFDALIIPLDKE